MLRRVLLSWSSGKDSAWTFHVLRQQPEVDTMSEDHLKTALITGANSGLGFEAASQLAELGYRRVILACRTLEKAQTASQ